MANEITLLWSQNSGGFARHATALPTNITIPKGHLALYLPPGGALPGGVMPLVSGTALNTLCTLISGADANGNLILRATESNVRLTLLAGTSTSLGVTVSYANAGFVDVIVQTVSSMGTISSTANDVVNAIRANGTASQYLHVIASGTGASIVVATTATGIVHLLLLGAAEETYFNTTGSTITTNMVFYTGRLANCVGKTGDVPGIANVGAEVTLVDDSFTLAATLDPMAFTGRLKDVDFSGRLTVEIDY